MNIFANSLKLVVAVVVTLGCFAAPATARQAFSVPVSDRLLEGVLTLPGGSQAEFVAQEGGLVTVWNMADGTTLGFVPILTGDNLQLVEILTLEIEEAEGGQTARQVGSPVTAGFGESTFLGTTAIQVEFRQASGDRDDISHVLGGASAGDTCCVTCGSVTVCACSVTMSCGSCCAGTCCGGGGGGTPGPRHPTY